MNNCSSIKYDAINNLLTNTVKYNTLRGKGSLADEETEDNIIFSISDIGIGNAEKEQNHIFEKVYRSDDDNVTRHSGYGRVIAFAKEIVALHQGKIDYAK